MRRKQIVYRYLKVANRLWKLEMNLKGELERLQLGVIRGLPGIGKGKRKIRWLNQYLDGSTLGKLLRNLLVWLDAVSALGLVWRGLVLGLV